MIQVICSREAYLYNAYHIVKAFYPQQEVSSCAEEKASNYVRLRFGDGQETEVSVGTGASGEALSCPEELLKEYLDKELYRVLSERTGRTLSWGILTGVRPTKIAMKKLNEGMEREIFLDWFTKELLVSPEKAALAWEVAEREKALLGCLDMENGYSLYVGIPFCPSICTYCSFSSGALSDWKRRVEEYLSALCRELAALAGMLKGRHLNTIYIGGGTPTTLSPEQLERLLSCIDAHFSREKLLEYTVEAGRPDSITKGKLEVLRAHGVTRISINPQSMQQKTLDAIGRKHTVEEVYDAFYLARACGFENINMDLIAGLPGEKTADMEDTLKQIQTLKPDSLTVHSLAVKRAARLSQEDAVSEDIGDMIPAASEAARQMGLVPYYLYRQKNIAGNFENVGYAKVDKAGIYNILIMEEMQTIVACGAGASTKIALKAPVDVPGSKRKKQTNLIRLENVKAIDAYISRVDEMIDRKGEWLWR